MVNSIILKPKLDLLNSNFDGYKLKSDSQSSVLMKKIEDGIYLNDKQEATCYLYTRMESLHNHLFSDPFELYSVYVFNSKGHLLMYTFSDDYVSSPSVVWQENLKTDSAKENDSGSSLNTFLYSPSVSFPSTHFAVTSNGSGTINILQTGDRSIGSSWVNLKELSVCCGKLVNSLLIETSEQKFKQEIHCLLLSVTTPQELKEKDLYQCINENIFNSKVSTLHILYWFTFGFDGSTWVLSRERRIIGLKTLEYISLDRKGEGVILLSHDDYDFVFDSQIPLQKECTSSEKQEKELPKYFFIQDNEEIKLWVNIGAETSEDDFRIDITPKDVQIIVKGNIILNKRFSDSIETNTTTWTLEKNGKLEICFVKLKENIRWPHLFEGNDKDGEELLDPILVEEVHNRLAHLTSDQWNPNPESEKPTFNPGQLEECDDASEDLILSVIDGKSHKVSHSSHLGAVQHLFNVQLDGSVIPSFCLRHDVDGLLWDHDEERKFEHIATFNAFGYVKASKAMAKFTKASPDNSYVAVADVNSHVYVFFQNDSLCSELRNRKSGKVETSIARQLIISLRNHSQVMGFYCAPKCVFILNETELFVYSLSS